MKISITLILLFSSVCSFCNVKPNSIFSNGAVLQRGNKIPVWGTADDGEKITLAFQQTYYTTTAKNGRWKIILKKPNVGGPFKLEIKGNNTVLIDNILVGDVWLCSGQSNMEKLMGFMKNQPAITNAAYEIANANYPQIRQFSVPTKFSRTGISNVNAKWYVCDTNNVKLFSAVAYFFARKLFEEKNIPIGIILSAVGGTHIESWINDKDLKGVESIEEIYEIYSKNYAQRQAELLQFNSDTASIIRKWKNDSTIASTNNSAIPPKPTAPLLPPKQPSEGALFNGMIIPIKNFPIAGFVWYQGESDRSLAKQYKELFPILIKSWRKCWGHRNLPFLFVQLPQYKTLTPEIRDAQLATYKKIKNTAMVVSIDCGEIDEIHSPNKKPIGERLAICANALYYGDKDEYMGPIYQSYKITNKNIELSFSHTGMGLIAKASAELAGFTISGLDKIFYIAKAIIVGNKVIVSSDKVTAPKHVRMGWTNIPEINLFNKDGFPASPFKTDH